MTLKQLYEFKINKMLFTFVYTFVTNNRHKIKKNRLLYNTRKYYKIRIKSVI